MPYNEQTPVGSSSASQYAAAALGVGLVALGIVMVVWSTVPTGSAGNSSRPGQGLGSNSSTSKAAYVMLAIGGVMLLLALCLTIRNKHREQRHQQTNTNAETDQGQDDDRQVEQAEHYAVPSYEEVVGTEEYNISNFTAQDNSTQLPAYEELMERPPDGLDGTNSAQPTQTQNGVDNSNPSNTRPAESNRKNGRPGLKMLPLKVRRIKSEKLGRKTSTSSPQVTVASIEPLTPPPQYEDIPPELPHLPK